jgi:hypothetical protein
MKNDDKTDPNMQLTHDDLMAYLVGAVHRIELQLASEPAWVSRLASRIEAIEKGCREKHGNGNCQKPAWGR